MALFIAPAACKCSGMTTLTTRNGTPLSRLTYGTMQFGDAADAIASQAMFNDACENGINHFDTARLYTDGASEDLTGRFIKPARDDLYLATKVGYIGGATRTNIIQQFDASRKQLGEDMVDLLYLHRFDDDTELEETFTTMAELQSKGQIRHIGVSNYAAWQIMKAQGIAQSLGTRIDAAQPMYNLVKRQSEVEIFPLCADQGISVFPYSPLGGGLLTGKYATGGTGRLTDDPRYSARYAQNWMHKTASDLADLSIELGTDAATLAVAWAACHALGPRPIISARSSEQLAPSLAAQTFDLDDALYARITALSVTPAPATDRLEEA